MSRYMFVECILSFLLSYKGLCVFSDKVVWWPVNGLRRGVVMPRSSLILSIPYLKLRDDQLYNQLQGALKGEPIEYMVQTINN
jgi:hypothetical protein